MIRKKSIRARPKLVGEELDFKERKEETMSSSYDYEQ